MELNVGDKIVYVGRKTKYLGKGGIIVGRFTDKRWGVKMDGECYKIFVDETDLVKQCIQ